MTHFLVFIDRHIHCSEYKFASEDRKKDQMIYLIFAMSFCYIICGKRIQHTTKRMNRQCI